MPSNESREIRLVEYLIRLAALRAKIIRDVSVYDQMIWLCDIPKEKNCYTRAWGPNEEYDEDIWIEIQTTIEPTLPSPPENCLDWINPNDLYITDDLPSLKDVAEIEENNPAQEGVNQLQLFRTIRLEDNPHIQATWDRYLENKWIPWAEEHQKWQKIHDIYTKFFEIYQEQLRLGEEYELVLALGLITWHTSNNQRIRRHLIVANALLEFEARLGKFIVRPNPDGSNLRPELDMLDIEDQPVHCEENARDSLKAASDDPWDKDRVEGVLKALIHSINPDGEYHDNFEPSRSGFPQKAISEYAPALILRKRSVKGLTEILKGIKKRIEEGEPIPPEFGDLAEIGREYREGLQTDDRENNAKFDDVEIYFPKPSNNEQIRIVEKIQHSSGVLVQGPPGTGKSHSIANLICHFLATGQRTLITAKTPRALKIIERLLPEELRPLCINLLGSGLEEKKSLEASVRAILTKNEEWREEDANNEISELENKLNTLRKERAEIQNRLMSIRESETLSQTIAEDAYTGTASQIAQAVNKCKESHGWFKDHIPCDKKLPYSNPELLNILKGLRALTEKKRKELSQKLPDSFLNTDEFRELVSEEKRAKEKANSAAENADKSFLDSISKLSEREISSVQDNLTQLRNEILRLKSLPHNWITEAVKDISLGDSAIWNGLHQIAFEIIKDIADKIDTADNTTFSIPDNRNPKSVLGDAGILKEHLESGGKLGWGPFRSKVVKSIAYVSKDITVDDNPCDSLERISALVDALHVHIEMNKAWELWSEWVHRTSGPYVLQFRQLESLNNSLSETLSIKSKIAACEEDLKKLGKAVNEYNKAKNEIQDQMKTGEEQSPKITGPVGTEREKLETMAKSMGVNVEKSDDELRKMISEKMGQKKKDEPENN